MVYAESWRGLHLDQIPAEAIEALERGNKIEAIKIVREAEGIGLKEAKGAVEAFLAGRPDIESRMKQASMAAARGGLSRLALVLGLLIVLWLLLRGQPAP